MGEAHIAHVRAGGVQEISVPSSQCCYETKTELKNCLENTRIKLPVELFMTQDSLGKSEEITDSPNNLDQSQVLYVK